jgi:hypothetical protein
VNDDTRRSPSADHVDGACRSSSQCSASTSAENTSTSPTARSTRAAYRLLDFVSPFGITRQDRRRGSEHRPPGRHQGEWRFVGVELTVPQKLDFGAGRLAVVPEFTRDVPAVSLERPQRLGGALPPWGRGVTRRVPLGVPRQYYDSEKKVRLSSVVRSLRCGYRRLRVTPLRRRQSAALLQMTHITSGAD